MGGFDRAGQCPHRAQGEKQDLLPSALPVGVGWVGGQAHNLAHPDLAVGHGVAVVLVVAEDAVVEGAPPAAELCVEQEDTQRGSEKAGLAATSTASPSSWPGWQPRCRRGEGLGPLHPAQHQGPRQHPPSRALRSCTGLAMEGVL